MVYYVIASLPQLYDPEIKNAIDVMNLGRRAAENYGGAVAGEFVEFERVDISRRR